MPASRADEAIAEKAKEQEHWEKAKQLGDHARAAGREEVERRFAQASPCFFGFLLERRAASQRSLCKHSVCN